MEEERGASGSKEGVKIESMNRCGKQERRRKRMRDETRVRFRNERGRDAKKSTLQRSE